MDETLKQNLTRRSIWIRVLYMILFAVVFELAKFVVLLIAVVQVLAKLLSGGVNEELRHFGGRLGRYLQQIVAFQTFHTEERPYPFSPFPPGSAVARTDEAVSPG
ncbi:MAG TPA: DUF4389 domain-containing protein [Alphaproteobacteria bacterium]|nr:DUF4389 domain-containing protein [Alphaproteobacteria bacterium]